MLSTIKLAKNNDSEACDSILQIGQLWVVMALSKNFTVRGSKCHSDDKHIRPGKNNDLEASDSILQIGHIIFWVVMK